MLITTTRTCLALESVKLGNSAFPVTLVYGIPLSIYLNNNLAEREKLEIRLNHTNFKKRKTTQKECPDQQRFCIPKINFKGNVEDKNQRA